MPAWNSENSERPKGKRQLRLTVACGKGGVGKSGLVINTASAAAAAGRSVVILDTDTDQHSCLEWRHAGGAVEVVKTDPADLKEALDSYRGVEVVLIDTCGAVLAAHSEAFDVADLILVPMSTSKRDYGPAIRVCKKAFARGRRARFVLSLVDPSATETRRTAGQVHLRSLMPPRISDNTLNHAFMQSVITRRVPLRDSMDDGGSAFSSAYTARSRAEFERLFSEIMTIASA